MSLAHPYEKSTVHVAPFTLEGDQLAIMMVHDEQGNLSLPNTPILPHHLEITEGEILTEAARMTLYTIFQDSYPTVEPLLVQGEQEPYSNSHFRIGYAAVTRLVQTSDPESSTTVPLHKVAGQAATLSDFDQQTIRLGLEEIQPPWYLGGSTGLTIEKSAHILSRLVRNPRRFRMNELHTAYQALLRGSLDPNEALSQKQLDLQDFYHSAQKHLPLVDTGATSQGHTGRPATFWSMSQRVLNVSCIPKGWLL